MGAESFGMNDCAEVIDDFNDVTTTVSLESEQSPLNVEPTLFGSPVAGVYVAVQWYVPTASGVKLTGPYVPSPSTVTDCGLVPVPVAFVVQSFLSSVKVIVPPAFAPGVVGSIAGVPGWCDVPLRAAVSVTGLPKTTSSPAVVG